MKKIFTLSFLLIVIIAIPIEFFINTKDGIGITENQSNLEYTLGFPYSEIGLKFPIYNDEHFMISFSGGFDIMSNSFQLNIMPYLNIDSFQMKFPVFLTTKPATPNEASEVGRLYFGVVPSIYLKDLNVKFEIGGYYSSIYFWYDPAFNLNIPTPKPDELFRTRIDLKITYIKEEFSIGIGYNFLIRWLSYRSMFITSNDTPYLEAKFKIIF